MVLYELRLSMLADKIRVEYLIFLQSWHNDEFRTAGAGAHFKPTIDRIESLGPVHGFFIEPKKSPFIRVPGVSEEAPRAAISLLECNHGEGARNLGFLWGVNRPNIYGWKIRWKLG